MKTNIKHFFSILLIVAVAAFAFVGCDIAPAQVDQQQVSNAKKQATVQNLMSKQDTARIDFSMDRYLLRERLERFNDPNKMSYLYVFTPDGPAFQFTIMGKVASTSKRLTAPVQKYKLATDGLVDREELGPAPDEMGVFGDSTGDAKVGMTTLGSLLEFGGFGFYIYSEVPISFTNMPPLVELKLTADEDEKVDLLNRLHKVQSMVQR